MSEENGDKLARIAIYALAAISIICILGGIAVAWFGQPVGSIIAIATGAVGGIVAIMLKMQDTKE